MKLFSTKLEADLKVYVSLYILMFCLSWLLIIPMLIHVHSNDECWLFITPRMEYGPNAVCHLIGYVALVVGIINLVLLVGFITQLSKFKKRKKQARHLRSKDFIENVVTFFSHLMKVHLVGNALILVVVAVITIGFATTCQHLLREVRFFVQKRYDITQYGYQDKRDKVERFEDESSYRKYTNGLRDDYGGDYYTQQISCRRVLMDPINHLKIKRNQDSSQRIIYGVYHGSDEYTDRGSLSSDTYRGNTTLEMSIAVSWILFVLWTGLFIFMFFKRRQYLKCRYTNTSFFGSEFGSHASSNRPRSKASSRYAPKSECNSYQSAVSPSMIGIEEEIAKYPQDNEALPSFLNNFEATINNEKLDLDSSLMNETDINGYLTEHVLDEELNSTIMGTELGSQYVPKKELSIPEIYLEDYNQRMHSIPNRVSGRRSERETNTTKQTVVL